MVNGRKVSSHDLSETSTGLLEHSAAGLSDPAKCPDWWILGHGVSGAVDSSMKEVLSNEGNRKSMYFVALTTNQACFQFQKKWWRRSEA